MPACLTAWNALFEPSWPSPSRSASRPEFAAGAHAQPAEKPAAEKPAADDGRLDSLFDRLRNTQDAGEARRTEAAIWQIWLEPATPRQVH